MRWINFLQLLSIFQHLKFSCRAMIFQRTHHEKAEALEWFNKCFSSTPSCFELLGKDLLRESSSCVVGSNLFMSLLILLSPYKCSAPLSNEPIKSSAPLEDTSSSLLWPWEVLAFPPSFSGLGPSSWIFVSAQETFSSSFWAVGLQASLHDTLVSPNRVDQSTLNTIWDAVWLSNNEKRANVFI